MDLDLTTFTEEELFQLRDLVNKRIDDIRQTERNEEVNRLRERYEGKCFLSVDGDIIRIDEIIDKYYARIWRCRIIESEDDDDMTMLVEYKEVNGLFQPKLTMSGKILENSYISRCTEISWEDTKKQVYKNFNRIRKEFLGLDDTTR